MGKTTETGCGVSLPVEEIIKLRILARAAALLIRAEWSLSQGDLAVMASTSQQVISLVEKGLPRAPIRVLRLLIEAAGLIRVGTSSPPLSVASSSVEQAST